PGIENRALPFDFAAGRGGHLERILPAVLQTAVQTSLSSPFRDRNPKTNPPGTSLVPRLVRRFQNLFLILTIRRSPAAVNSGSLRNLLPGYFRDRLVCSTDASAGSEAAQPRRSRDCALVSEHMTCREGRDGN